MVGIFLYFWLMTHGICGLNLIPLREAGKHDAPLVSEVLYGELFQVVTAQKNWSKVRLADYSEGWLDNSQFIGISTQEYADLTKKDTKTATDLVEFVLENNTILFPIAVGSSIQNCAFLGHTFEGATTSLIIQKEKIPQTAFIFLNTPFKQGGKSPFGIDASGFTQIVYKLCGVLLPRTAATQSTLGEVLSFIEESEAGDLAFFDDQEGNINHVGIILENNHIIHAAGHVRVDRLDQTGIFNTAKNTHTHKLRLIKSIA